ncbi:MAG TPA: glucan biosynthesis protein D [Steroidobacteraceae bacterium]|nr:glucan biosynthesis protein D [Steroidobacteraceae bacterium]
MMQRTAAALSAAGLPFGPLLQDAFAAAPASPVRRLGKPEPFDYARLKGTARQLGNTPYKPRPDALPPAIAGMDWDHWQSIRFRNEKSLWGEDHLRFQARFFHLGFTMKKPVRMYVVENGQVQELGFDRDMFDYSRSGLKPQDVPENLGFAGFRVNYHTDWQTDMAAFQGASYFRAIDGDLQYGMSQRGLAVDTGMPYPEEWPEFVAYYLERPQPAAGALTVYGLLDSPSVAGAYRFVIEVGDTLVMDVDAALYPRRQIERIGIAPGTSMYLFGQNDRRMAVDWRPQIHDSDGLQIWTGTGEWIWRPLMNPAVLRTNSFLDNSPRGFGLMQRERSFSQYEDDGVFYEKRPSVWVEPKARWGAGQVMLVEIPTVDETFDNIVAFWNPAEKPQKGQELLFGYKLYWCREIPVASGLATVRATRTGIGGIVGQKRTHFSWRFVVDFAGGDFGLLGPHADVVPVISASRGIVEITSARPFRELNGWRAMFDLRLTDDSVEPINLRLYLSQNGQPLTETWLYQYTPVPPDERDLEPVDRHALKARKP